MKKKKMVFAAAAACLCAVAGTLLFTDASSRWFGVGQARRDAAGGSDEAVAYYKETAITRAAVDFEIKADAEREEAARYNQSEREIIDRLLRGLVLLDEAKELGLEATDEEIAAFVEQQKQIYEDFPEGRQAVDDFCAGAGMTLEEHWAVLEEQAPHTLARGKVRQYIGQEACKKAGLEGKEGTDEYRAVAQAAIKEYEDALLERHAADISYR